MLRPDRPLIAVLVVGCAILVPFVAGSGLAQPGSAATPAGIQAAGDCILHTFNHDSVRPATVVADFFRQGFGAPVAITLPPIAPQSDHALDLAIQSSLANGAYSAMVSADAAVGSLSHCMWLTSGGAILTNSTTPGTAMVVPLLARRYNGMTSLVSIQNSDPNQQATVTVKVYQTGNSTPAATRSYPIPRGSSITLDLGYAPDFEALPPQFLGWMMVESATPVAVHSFVDYENSQKGVQSSEGVAIEEAAAELVAPYVAHAAPMNPGTPGTAVVDSYIAVANPGSAPAAVSIHYSGSSGTCAAQTFTHGPIQLAPNGNALFYQGNAGTGSPTGPSPLPPGCAATARVTAVGGKVVATVVLEHLDGGAVAMEAAAYNALAADGAATVAALPLLRRGQYGNSSAVWVMNTGADTATANLRLTEAMSPTPADCGADCTAAIPPGQAHLWWLDDIASFGRGKAGFGTVSADQPLAVAVLDVPVGGIDDLAAYLGLTAPPGPVGRGASQLVPLLLRSGSGPRPTPAPAVQRVDTGPFSVELPEDWSYVPRQGIDSFVGDFVGPGMTLRFDYGQYWNSRPAAGAPGYEVRQEDVDFRPAEIWLAREDPADVTALYVDYVEDRLRAWHSPVRLSLVGKNLTPPQQEVAVQIMRSVHFTRHIPEDGQWEVFAELPATSLVDLDLAPAPGTDLRVAGGYYGTGTPNPVGAVYDYRDGAWHRQLFPGTSIMGGLDGEWAIEYGDRKVFRERSDGAWDTVLADAPGLVFDLQEARSGVWLAGIQTLGYYKDGQWSYEPGMTGGIGIDLDHDDNGWVVGGNSLNRQEAGVWRVEPWPGPGNGGLAVDSVSPREAWFAGGSDVDNDGFLLHWRDGVWNHMPNMATAELWGLDLVSSAEGWSVGGHSSASRTCVVTQLRDGVWEPHLDVCVGHLHAVKVDPDGTTWAVGYRIEPGGSFSTGLVLRYTDVVAPTATPSATVGPPATVTPSATATETPGPPGLYLPWANKHR